MPDPFNDSNSVRFERLSFRDLAVALPLHPTIRVLVVVDSEIQVANAAGSFGVGRFIRLLRETEIGCTRFSVDVASRDTLSFSDAGAGGDGHVRYPGFRFDSVAGGKQVIDGYHEVFLFGFKPDNSGGPDSRIDDANLPGVIPLQSAEKAAIDAFMDAGRGVFATGDHDYLGATMCHRIQRVRSMRKWTNSDGVPPIGGTTRIDTHQPATPGQRSGAAVIPSGAQSDAVPQPIEWVPVSSYRVGFLQYRRPHEVLCHPTHGPIDVMPDHAHEGLCFTREEIEASAERRAEFPGTELPQVVAFGRVVPDPPHQHAKGDVNPQHFPMISVYDGWKEDVGRVVVDSTWHHWMDINVTQLEASGGDNWEKISRYFVNVAKWIAPEGVYQSRCWWEILRSHYAGAALEEYRLGLRPIELGTVLYDRLTLLHGPCTVRQLVLKNICEIAPELCIALEKRFQSPVPLPCLTCPPIELLERVVLGGMVEGTRPLAQKVRDGIEAGEAVEVRVEEIERSALEGARAALDDFSQDVVRSAEEVGHLFAGPRKGR